MGVLFLGGSWLFVDVRLVVEVDEYLDFTNTIYHACQGKSFFLEGFELDDNLEALELLNDSSSSKISLAISNSYKNLKSILHINIHLPTPEPTASQPYSTSSNP